MGSGPINAGSNPAPGLFINNVESDLMPIVPLLVMVAGFAVAESPQTVAASVTVANRVCGAGMKNPQPALGVAKWSLYHKNTRIGYRENRVTLCTGSTVSTFFLVRSPEYKPITKNLRVCVALVTSHGKRSACMPVKGSR